VAIEKLEVPYLLRYAIFKDLNFLRSQIANDVSLLIADHDVEHHLVNRRVYAGLSLLSES
jgi:hypothetical protein